jgi:hypothetical protein
VVGQFRTAGGLVLLSGGKLGPQISCRSQIRSARRQARSPAVRQLVGVFIMRWISTFDRYDLILAAAISGLFAVALSFGFI